MSAPRYPLEFLRRQKPAWKTPGIDARAVAEKLKAIRDLRHPANAERLAACPKLGHLLWFIQDRSHQPGGLELFARDLLLASPERLQTKAMADIRWPRSGRYTVEQCVRIWRGLEGDATRPKGFPDGVDGEDEPIDDEQQFYDSGAIHRRRRAREWTERVGTQVREVIRVAGDQSAHDKPELARELFRLLAAEQSFLRKLSPSDSEASAFVVAALTPEVFWTRCARETLAALPAALVALATAEEEDFDSSTEGRDALKPETWRGPLPCFDGLIPALFDYMDHHAEKGRRTIADTSVSATVTDRFEFALTMGANALIVGDARLGKTVTLKNDCRRHPGRARLVTLPSKTNVPALVHAHANALHMSYDRGRESFGLESDVRYVLQHSGLLICYDELHFAIPTGKSNRTPPALDWIRTNVVDRNLGVVFSATRQAYNKGLSNFMQHTKWAIAQWAGRIDTITQIGEDKEEARDSAGLTFDDVLAITLNKQPDLERDVAEMVAEEALGAASPAHAVHSILLSAGWLARKAHPRSVTPTDADVEAAIQEWKLQPAHDEFENASGPPKIRQASAPVKPSAAPPPERGSLTAATPPGARHASAGSEAAAPHHRLSTPAEPALAGR